jgi:hypothetical protein
LWLWIQGGPWNGHNWSGAPFYKELQLLRGETDEPTDPRGRDLVPGDKAFKLADADGEHLCRLILGKEQRLSFGIHATDCEVLCLRADFTATATQFFPHQRAFVGSLVHRTSSSVASVLM